MSHTETWWATSSADEHIIFNMHFGYHHSSIKNVLVIHAIKPCRLFVSSFLEEFFPLTFRAKLATIFLILLVFLNRSALNSFPPDRSMVTVLIMPFYDHWK